MSCFDTIISDIRMEGGGVITDLKTVLILSWAGADPGGWVKGSTTAPKNGGVKSTQVLSVFEKRRVKGYLSFSCLVCVYL